MIKNRYISFLYAFLYAFFSLKTDVGSHGDVSSRTVFNSIAFFQKASPERLIFEKVSDACDWIIQATFFSGGSTNQNGMARYFGPYGNSVFSASNGPDYFEPKTIGGYGNPSGEDNKSLFIRNLDATHFNIPPTDGQTTFRSILELNPEEKYHGVGFLLQKPFKWDDEGFAKWKIELAAPIIHLENDFRFYEDLQRKIQNADLKKGIAGANHVKTVLDGLDLPEMKYGKIHSKESMDDTHLGNIEINILHKGLFKKDICSSETHFGIVLPTGQKLSDEDNKYAGYLWEPIVGNRNWGIQFGSQIELYLHCGENSNTRSLFAGSIMYGFPNTQKRTYDLIQKPWSRYMTVWNNREALEQSTDPLNDGNFLCNKMTLDTKVWPRFKSISSVALLHEQHTFQGMIGYSFLTRQAEYLEIKEDLDLVALKGRRVIDSHGSVSLARTIQTQFIASDVDGTVKTPLDNYADYQIQAGNIDMNSATHPTVFTGTIFGSIGNRWDVCDEYPLHIKLGGAYRMSPNNTAPEGWMGWLTFNLIF